MLKPKTCCCVVPIFLGVMILCFLQLFMACFAIYQIFSILRGAKYQTNEEVIWIVCYCACAAPIIIGGYYYLRWLISKTTATKVMLPRAHFLNIVSILMQFALLIIFGYAVEGRPI